MMRVSDEAETDLARASKTLDAAVALRELRLESDVVAPWREDISDIVALAARPLRGRCGAAGPRDVGAFCERPRRGERRRRRRRGIWSRSRRGPSRPCSSTGRSTRATRRGATACAWLVGPEMVTNEPGLFWTTADEDADDAATAGPGGCARLRAAGPGAADHFETSRPAPAAARRAASSRAPPAPRARRRAERAGLDADFVDEVSLVWICSRSRTTSRRR